MTTKVQTGTALVGLGFGVVVGIAYRYDRLSKRVTGAALLAIGTTAGIAVGRGRGPKSSPEEEKKSEGNHLAHS